MRAGGAVEGGAAFGGGIEAELKVTGRFSDGYLWYARRLRSPAIRLAAPWLMVPGTGPPPDPG